MPIPHLTRRDILVTTGAIAAVACLAPESVVAAGAGAGKASPGAGAPTPGPVRPGQPALMDIGLVTYMWGADWDLPTLLANCRAAGLGAIELRTEHKHGVEPRLTKPERDEVRKRFADAGLVCLGYGSNQKFDDVDPAALARSIEASKVLLQLVKDIGGTGLKVKPNDFQKNVAKEKTIEQIGRGLNEVGKAAGDLGLEVRLEIHGQCAPIPIIKQIMDVADSPHVALCWNSNKTDLDGDGLEKNFALVRHRFGATLHTREWDDAGYPHDKLMRLAVASGWKGWALLECTTKPADRVAAMRRQLELFVKMKAEAEKRGGK